MADNDTQQQDRTEQPSPKKLADARLRGRVPRSRELSMTMVMLASAAAFLWMRPMLTADMQELLASGLTIERAEALDVMTMPLSLGHSVAAGLAMLAPLWIVLSIAAIAGSLTLGGWVFSAEALLPKIEKLNPVSGIKRVFGWTGLSELGKALAKFLIVALAAIGLLWWLAPEFMRLGALSPKSAIARTTWLAAVSFAGISAALLLITAYDVPFQYWQFRRQMRMTKQETKEEQKETEGRPEVRSRIRQAQQDIATRRMIAEVPKADMVAMNPTHYAVALRYDAKTMRAPKVVAKGTDLLALTIRRVAQAHNVPIFEHPPLAQALYHTSNLNQEISPRLYVAVAQVLTYIYQLTGRSSPPQGAKPQRPTVDIEPDLLIPLRARRRAERMTQA
jgi:flagellar biosynthetic protein FlhB